MKQYALAVLIIILASQGVAYYKLSTASDEAKSGYYFMVEIEQRDADGNLVDKRCIEDDLILRNWAYWQTWQMSGDDFNDMRATYYPKDTTGASITVGSPFYDPYITYTNAYMHIGEGAVAPAIGDYVLGSQVMQERITDRLFWESGTQFNCTFDCLFLIDGTYAITEVGMSTNLEAKQMMVCRDTFPAINVNAGDTLLVRYFLLFNWS